MYNYDFCFAWSWPYDVDFAELLQQTCQEEQISILQVTPQKIDGILEVLKRGELNFRAFFDRASDTDPLFEPLADWAYRQNLTYINRFWLAKRSWDKAKMHHLFTRNGIDAPYTVVLPSFLENPELPRLDLSPFEEYFALKPAHGGGGAGVIIGSLTWDQILQYRQQQPKDQYLLQALAVPKKLENRPAWFRVIYCLGKTFPCWWDPFTHRYSLVSEDELERFELTALSEIVTKIAGLSHLELFSTEIAFTNGNRFLVVDYINDPIDLRPMSKVPEGVPDSILKVIAQELTIHIRRSCLPGNPYV